MNTDKQVVSGYHRPVCRKCHCELRPEKNGVGVVDVVEGKPQELYDADLWKCPKCGVEIVGGFGRGPISHCWAPGFAEALAEYHRASLLIRNED